MRNKSRKVVGVVRSRKLSGVWEWGGVVVRGGGGMSNGEVEVVKTKMYDVCDEDVGFCGLCNYCVKREI